MLTRKLGKFWQLTATGKTALIEAALALVFARAVSLILPHDVWLKIVAGKANKVDHNSSKADQSVVDLVSRSVVSAANNLPWASNCLRNALAGRLMLARRGIKSEIILGARPNQELSGDAVEFHGWLNVDGNTIIGGEDLDGYRQLSTL